jgi:hypothetical protein
VFTVRDSCCCHPPGHGCSGQHLGHSASWLLVFASGASHRWRRLDLVGHRRWLLPELMAIAAEFSEKEAVELLADCIDYEWDGEP